MIGIVAACLTTFAFAPQVIKIIKDKNTKSISLICKRREFFFGLFMA